MLLCWEVCSLINLFTHNYISLVSGDGLSRDEFCDSTMLPFYATLNDQNVVPEQLSYHTMSR